MGDESEQLTRETVLRTTRRALSEAGYALVGAGAYALDAVRGDRDLAADCRRVGERTAELTRTASQRTAEGLQTLSDRGRTVMPEFDELRSQARAVMGDVSAAAADMAEEARAMAGETGTRARGPAEAGTAVSDEAAAATGADYTGMTVDELREHAREADITGRSQMNKAELIDALQEWSQQH